MVDKDAVRRGYDEIGDAYEAERAPDPDAVAAIEGLLNRFPADGRLLDAGCGHGEPVLVRAEDVRAFGLDVSAGQVERARANAPSAGLFQGDMTALPVAEEAVDAITAFHSLIHVPMDEHRAVLEELARVLRPGGELLLTEGTGEWSGRHEDWLEGGAAMEWDIAGPERTRSQLRAAGFEVVDEWELVDELAEEEATHALFLARTATE